MESAGMLGNEAASDADAMLQEIQAVDNVPWWSGVLAIQELMAWFESPASLKAAAGPQDSNPWEFLWKVIGLLTYPEFDAKNSAKRTYQDVRDYALVKQRRRVLVFTTIYLIIIRICSFDMFIVLLLLSNCGVLYFLRNSRKVNVTLAKRSVKQRVAWAKQWAGSIFRNGGSANNNANKTSAPATDTELPDGAKGPRNSKAVIRSGSDPAALARSPAAADADHADGAGGAQPRKNGLFRRLKSNSGGGGGQPDAKANGVELSLSAAVSPTDTFVSSEATAPPASGPSVSGRKIPIFGKSKSMSNGPAKPGGGAAAATGGPALTSEAAKTPNNSTENLLQPTVQHATTDRPRRNRESLQAPPRAVLSPSKPPARDPSSSSSSRRLTRSGVRPMLAESDDPPLTQTALASSAPTETVLAERDPPLSAVPPPPPSRRSRRQSMSNDPPLLLV
jgi:hypothetical protein